MIGSTAGDWALLLTAVGGVVVAAATAASTVILAVATARRQGQILTQAKDTHTEVVAVHAEVKTLNGMAMGELADAAESRRIDALPPSERTDADDEHLEVVPIPEA